MVCMFCTDFGAPIFNRFESTSPSCRSERLESLCQLKGTGFIAAVFMLILAFTPAGHVLADLPPGANEYLEIISTQEELKYLMAETYSTERPKDQVMPKELFLEKAPLIREAKEKIIVQLQKSSDLGFAPAQFTYARYLKMQGAGRESREMKVKICELVNHAAESGLLVAELSRGIYCSNASLRDDPADLARKTSDMLQRLAIATTIQDPFEAYYPLEPFDLMQCFVRDSENSESERSPIQGLLDRRPVPLTLSQIKAEAFYKLAFNFAFTDKVKAHQYLNSAEKEGCSKSKISDLAELIKY